MQRLKKNGPKRSVIALLMIKKIEDDLRIVRTHLVKGIVCSYF